MYAAAVGEAPSQCDNWRRAVNMELLAEMGLSPAAGSSVPSSGDGPRVLVTVDEQAFVEYPDGTRAWVAASSVGVGGVSEDAWRAKTAAALASPPPAPPADGSAPHMEFAADGQIVLVRGLFRAAELAEVYALGKDCLDAGWGTVRRRSVGLPEDGVARTPAQTHLRLSRHFLARAPAAWSALRSAVAKADAVHLGSALAAAVRKRDASTQDGGEEMVAGGGDQHPFANIAVLDTCFKQADSLVYHGARDMKLEGVGAGAGAGEGGGEGVHEVEGEGEGEGGDWVGWHDHAGESVLFAVVMLADPRNFEGGSFCCRRDADSPVHAMQLGLGDAVICPSATEHCVRPVRAGTRCSINIDFWAVKSDNRSPNDLY